MCCVTIYPGFSINVRNDDPLLLENALCATRRGSMTVGVLGLSVQDRCHRAVKILISSYDIDSEIGDLKKYFILC